MNEYRERDEQKSATILYFPRKRGRPKSAQKGSDSGTPELAMKRLLGETAETLDLCLERGIINAQQHWCGIHLRWLYTLRYGAPGLRAIDPTHIGGMEVKIDDPEWRIAREKEYSDAIKKITVSGHALLLMNLCIYNERPKFLNLTSQTMNKDLKETTEMLANLRDGRIYSQNFGEDRCFADFIFVWQQASYLADRPEQLLYLQIEELFLHFLKL